jgi:hypothetical protein
MNGNYVVALFNRNVYLQLLSLWCENKKLLLGFNALKLLPWFSIIIITTYVLISVEGLT